MIATSTAVLTCWFGDPAPGAPTPDELTHRWFAGGEALDREIAARFGETLAAAERGECDDWVADPASRLALIVLLDQFSRNVHRGTPRAFANDPAALRLALGAIDRGEDRALHPHKRMFIYLPLEHAEDRAMQDRCVALFEAMRDDVDDEWKTHVDYWLHYAEVHRDVIRRFGRFPSRNAVLGRTTTPDEQHYLDTREEKF